MSHHRNTPSPSNDSRSAITPSPQTLPLLLPLPRAGSTTSTASGSTLTPIERKVTMLPSEGGVGTGQRKQVRQSSRSGGAGSGAARRRESSGPGLILSGVGHHLAAPTFLTRTTSPTSSSPQTASTSTASPSTISSTSPSPNNFVLAASPQALPVHSPALSPTVIPVPVRGGHFLAPVGQKGYPSAGAMNGPERIRSRSPSPGPGMSERVGQSRPSLPPNAIGSSQGLRKSAASSSAGSVVSGNGTPESAYSTPAKGVRGSSSHGSKFSSPPPPLPLPQDTTLPPLPPIPSIASKSSFGSAGSGNIARRRKDEEDQQQPQQPRMARDQVQVEPIQIPSGVPQQRMRKGSMPILESGRNTQPSQGPAWTPLVPNRSVSGPSSEASRSRNSMFDTLGPAAVSTPPQRTSYYDGAQPQQNGGATQRGSYYEAPSQPSDRQARDMLYGGVDGGRMPVPKPEQRNGSREAGQVIGLGLGPVERSRQVSAPVTQQQGSSNRTSSYGSPSDGRSRSVSAAPEQGGSMSNRSSIVSPNPNHRQPPPPQGYQQTFKAASANSPEAHPSPTFSATSSNSRGSPVQGRSSSDMTRGLARPKSRLGQDAGRMSMHEDRSPEMSSSYKSAESSGSPSMGRPFFGWKKNDSPKPAEEAGGSWSRKSKGKLSMPPMSGPSRVEKLPRRSEDMLGGREPWEDFAESAAPVSQTASPNGLGMGHPSAPAQRPSMQPRKSSGGLRALFGLGKKDKDKDKDMDQVKHAIAPSPEPVYTAPAQPRRRASEDLLRTRARTRETEDNEAVLLVPSPDPNVMARRSLGEMGGHTEHTGHAGLDLPAFDPQMARRSVYQPVEVDAQYGDDNDDNDSEESALPRSASLHLLDLPKMDLSMGSTFDIFSKTLESPRKSPKRSPNRKSLAVADQKGSRRRSRSFSEFSRSHSSGLTADPMPTASQRLMAVTAQETTRPMPAPPALDLASQDGNQSSIDHSLGTMPAPALSDHGRTFSGTSNSVTDSSPPRTPGSSESHLVVATSGSWDNMSIPLSHSGEMASLGKAWISSPLTQEVKNSRMPKPRLLQLSENRDRPRTIIEQTESPVTPTAPELVTAPIILAPAADIVSTKAEVSAPSKPFSRGRDVMTRGIAVGSRLQPATTSMTPLHLAREMRRILQLFRCAAPGKGVDRAGLIRVQLLDVLVEGEKREFQSREQEGNAAVRGVCADWIECLLTELTKEQAANERGACLEALSAIVESQWLSTQALKGYSAAQGLFRNVMVRIMTYVLDKLSGKGVFHNTLLFSGRMLAFAFFRIEGIAHQLLAALPVKNSILSRFAHGALHEAQRGQGASEQLVFPAHLGGLQYDCAKAYNDRLASLKPEYRDPREAEAFLFRPGNWLRRWQSDDSELFPAFYKAYHRQLASYLGPAVEYYESSQNQPVPVSVLFEAPGYAHLAAIFSAKTHGYIIGAINAVTTTSAVSTFNADETAGTKGNVKPPALETANRRLTETVLALTNSRLFLHSATLGVIECHGTSLWGCMIDIWIKSLITKTSLYAPKGVFCLLDLLDGIITGPLHPVGSPQEDQSFRADIPFLDVPYLISIVRLVLTQTDHHLTLAKCIAFVWTHYEALCARVEDREELCMKLLLDPVIFERLMLFWSQSVRSYVLRLVVFRLGHIFTTPGDIVNHEMEVATVQLLNLRLENIRRRHDELEPREEKFSAMMLERAEDGSLPINGIPRSKSTITMIPADPSPEPPTRAERLLSLGAGVPVASIEPSSGGPELMESKGQGKPAGWFKRSFTKQKKGKGSKAGSEQDSRAAHKLGAGNSPSSTGLATPPQPTARATKDADVDAELAKGNSPHSDDSFEGHLSALQPRAFAMPVISHTPPIPAQVPGTPPAKDKSSHSPTQFAFAFELPTASPRSDTFDKRPVSHSPRSSVPGSTPPRLPPSPHMSRSFSRRSSLLHPTAASVADGPASPSFRRSLATVTEQIGYDKRLHPYCIRMLAELEDVQKEYEEWWAEDGPGRMDNAPPRLNVAWPFSEEED